MNLMSQFTLSVPIHPFADVMFHFAIYRRLGWIGTDGVNWDTASAGSGRNIVITLSIPA